MSGSLIIGVALALNASIIWGINSIIMKKGAVGEDPAKALMWRGLSGGVTLAIITILVYGWKYLTRLLQPDIFWLVLTTAFLVSMGDSLMIYSFKKAPVSVVVPVSSTYPLFGAFFVILFKIEPFSWLKIIGTIIVIIGIGIIAQQTANKEQKFDEINTPSNITGIIVSLSASVFWGLSIAVLSIILSKPMVNGMSLTAVRAFLIAFIGGTFHLIRYRTGKWKYKIDKEGQKKARNLFLLSGILGWAIGVTSFMYAIQKVGALIATPLSATNPLFATIFGILLLKEEVTAFQLIGIVLVVIGSVIVVF